MDFPVVHVTVGTTKFDELIQVISSATVLKLLQARKCRQLILQLGSSAAVEAEPILGEYGIEVIQYDFKFEPTRTDIIKADLVIGHAGAGTCIDILHHGKPALIVVNPNLMDNHQLELAEQLAEEGYIHFCQIDEVEQSLQLFNFADLKRYDSTNATENVAKFVNYLNGLILPLQERRK